MKSEERRKRLLTILADSTEPVSGSKLSELLDVSRQIIVQDIALIKAAGHDIVPTHYGYVLKRKSVFERTFKLRHTSAETEDELSLIVSLGGTVVNVYVWHKVYGRIEARLNIFSKRGVKQFIDGIKSGKSSELMHITSGYHYHTVSAESSEILDKIENALSERGYIVPEI